MDQILSIKETESTEVVATVSRGNNMDPERHEPPLSIENIPSSRDQNGNPLESFMKVLISLIQIS